MKQRRIANRESVWNVLARSMPTTDADATAIMVKIRTAWQLLKDGNGDDATFDRVGAAMNVGTVRAEQIDTKLVEYFSTAADALNEARRIEAAHGRLGFTGPGLVAVERALEAYEELLRASSPLQMHRAAEEAARRVQRMQQKQEAISAP